MEDSYKKVTCGDKMGTAITNMLNIIESGTFVVPCTDNRGNTSSTTIIKEMIEY